ncbi:MAG: hypothetical protein ACK5MP_01655 [Nostocoides sp.]
MDIARPQGIGAFPLPAGLLLIGPGPGHDEVRSALVAGQTPSQWPDSLRGHDAAFRGDTEAAIATFTGQDAVSAFNRYVLDPDGIDAAQVRQQLPDDLAVLVDLVDYMLGRADHPPTSLRVRDDVAALVISAQASAALEEQQVERAMELLDGAAAACPPEAVPLQALLRGQCAILRAENGGDVGAAVIELETVLRLLEETDLNPARAELHQRLGALLHESAADGGMLQPAVAHYSAAVALVDEESAPEVWAMAHLGLGTAYLMMPMTQASDALRSAVAISSLRSARRVFDPISAPSPWSSATLNLANALVYSPSRKQGDNLTEAVDLYEEVLALRDRDTDPLGRARVLTNQGNALAHLGVFDHAKAKLAEARFIFEEHLDHDSVMTVRSILDEIARAGVPDEDGAAAGEAS